MSYSLKTTSKFPVSTLETQMRKHMLLQQRITSTDNHKTYALNGLTTSSAGFNSGRSDRMNVFSGKQMALNISLEARLCAVITNTNKRKVCH